MKKKKIQGGDDGTPTSEDETNPTGGAEAEGAEEDTTEEEDDESEEGTQPDDANESDEGETDDDEADDEDDEVVKLTKSELQALINRTVQKRLARASKGSKEKSRLAGSKREASDGDDDVADESRTPISELSYTQRDHWEDQIEELKDKARKLPKAIRSLLPYDLNDEDLTPREVRLAKKWIRRAAESNVIPKKPTVTKETAKKGNGPDPKASRVKDRKLEDLVAEARKQSRYNSW